MKVGNRIFKVGNINASIAYFKYFSRDMYSLTEKYLKAITFTTEQVSALRSLGEYRGKQALFFKQSPETLNSLRLVAKIESIAQQTQDPLILIPLAILDFLCIHPFTDGNGRMSRLLTLMLLYQSDYQVGRYISLERIFEESKEGYYETLEDCSKHWHQGKHNAKPWLNYFWGVLLRAYREFEDRVGVITTSKGSKTELVRNAINRRVKPFSINDIESDCPGVSRDMIRRVLRQMRNERLVTVSSSGRGASWQKTNI